MDELKCILLSEGSQAEKVTCCMILTIRHSGKSKTLKTVKRSVVARGSGEEQMNGGTQRIFRAVKTILYNTIMMDTCHYIFTQTQRM